MVLQRPARGGGSTITSTDTETNQLDLEAIDSVESVELPPLPQLPKETTNPIYTVALFLLWVLLIAACLAAVAIVPSLMRSPPTVPADTSKARNLEISIGKTPRNLMSTLIDFRGDDNGGWKIGNKPFNFNLGTQINHILPPNNKKSALKRARGKLRRLQPASLIPRGAPVSFMDMYCRYGCGTMPLTFPYYYRPFFGYGFPLVGTDSRFPIGYGGNPTAKILASQEENVPLAPIFVPVI